MKKGLAYGSVIPTRHELPLAGTERLNHSPQINHHHSPLLTTHYPLAITIYQEVKPLLLLSY